MNGITETVVHRHQAALDGSTSRIVDDIGYISLAAALRTLSKYKNDKNDLHLDKLDSTIIVPVNGVTLTLTLTLTPLTPSICLWCNNVQIQRRRSPAALPPPLYPGLVIVTFRKPNFSTTTMGSMEKSSSCTLEGCNHGHSQLKPGQSNNSQLSTHSMPQQIFLVYF
eukprot:gene4197-biopygen1539